jgi:hypothetical protein
MLMDAVWARALVEKKRSRMSADSAGKWRNPPPPWGIPRNQRVYTGTEFSLQPEPKNLLRKYSTERFIEILSLPA